MAKNVSSFNRSCLIFEYFQRAFLELKQFIIICSSIVSSGHVEAKNKVEREMVLWLFLLQVLWSYRAREPCFLSSLSGSSSYRNSKSSQTPGYAMAHDRRARFHFKSRPVLSHWENLGNTGKYLKIQFEKKLPKSRKMLHEIKGVTGNVW